MYAYKLALYVFFVLPSWHILLYVRTYIANASIGYIFGVDCLRERAGLLRWVDAP